MKKRWIIIIAVFIALLTAILLLPKTGSHGGPPAGAIPGNSSGSSEKAPAQDSAPASGNQAPQANGDKNMPGGVPGKSGGKNAGGPPFGTIVPSVFTIRSQEVVVQDLHSYLKTNGDVEVSSSIEVYPDTSGKLASVHVALGSKVQKGQIIADVDPSKPGATYSLSPVYAPIDGTVTSLPLQRGATVSTNTVVAIIGDIDNLQVSARIPERDIAVLKTGLSAIITLEAYPGVEFSATVSRVSPVVDSTSRTKEIYLVFDTDDSRINAGMFAKVKLFTTVTRNCIAIPQESITISGDKKYVYVVKSDNTVSKREVTTGVTVDEVTQIVTGLQKGERVVIEGLQILTDGAAIKDIATKENVE